MPKITLQLDDSDMAELEALALGKDVSAEKILVEAVKAQLVRGLRGKRSRSQAATGAADNALAETSNPNRTATGAISGVDESGDLASRQAARRAALLPAFGMWADDETKPKDGVAYQKAIRAEWE